MSDLRASDADREAGQLDRKPRGWVISVLGGAERHGRWRPAAVTNVIALMGGAALDLREAEIGAGIRINAIGVMGGVEVIVPEGVEVELRGFALLGSKGGPEDGPAPPGAPVVRVRAYALMGGVGVSRTPPG